VTYWWPSDPGFASTDLLWAVVPTVLAVVAPLLGLHVAISIFGRIAGFTSKAIEAD